MAEEKGEVIKKEDPDLHPVFEKRLMWLEVLYESFGHHQSIRYLQSREKIPDKNIESIFRQAVKWDRFSIVQLLLETGRVNINCRSPFDNNTLLYWCVLHRRNHMAKYLLRGRADPVAVHLPSERDPSTGKLIYKPRTAVLLAAHTDNEEMVELLIERYGASFAYINRSGQYLISILARGSCKKLCHDIQYLKLLFYNYYHDKYYYPFYRRTYPESFEYNEHNDNEIKAVIKKFEELSSDLPPLSKVTKDLHDKNGDANLPAMLLQALKTCNYLGSTLVKTSAFLRAHFHERAIVQKDLLQWVKAVKEKIEVFEKIVIYKLAKLERLKKVAPLSVLPGEAMDEEKNDEFKLEREVSNDRAVLESGEQEASACAYRAEVQGMGDLLVKQGILLSGPASVNETSINVVDDGVSSLRYAS